MSATRALPINRKYSVLAICFGFFSIWVAYLLLTYALYLHTEIRNFETEGYITDMTVSEAWRFANRPIVVPLIYKAAHNYGPHIARFQYVISVLAWTFLGLVTMTLFTNPFIRFTGFLLTLAFSLSREVYFWNSLLLSESLSHSFLILLISLCIWLAFGDLPSRIKRWVIPFTVICAVIWGSTRDSNTVLLLVWGGGLAFWAGYSTVGGKLWILTIAYILILTCFVQYRHAEQGSRWHVSFINILGDRILPDSEATQFFADRGMPLNDDVTRYTNQRAWAYFPAHDMRTGLGRWLDEEGRTVYAQYLLSRPVSTVLAPIINWKPILAYQHSLAHLAKLYEDEDSPYWQQTVSFLVYPNWMVLPLVLFISIGLAILENIRSTDRRYLIPIIGFFSAYFLALIAWHSDADSIERHAFQVGILVRLSLWGIVLLFLDRLLALTKAKNYFTP